MKQAYERYGIEVGQSYVPADGSKNRLVVRDVTTFAACDDVVVFDESQACERRIDAFKLAKVRYSLVYELSVALLQALRAGTATAEQQAKAATELLRLAQALADQRGAAERGNFVVKQGEWIRHEDEFDGKRTWLRIRVADDADLSSPGTRADALDCAIRKVNK